MRGSGVAGVAVLLVSVLGARGEGPGEITLCVRATSKPDVQIVVGRVTMLDEKLAGARSEAASADRRLDHGHSNSKFTPLVHLKDDQLADGLKVRLNEDGDTRLWISQSFMDAQGYAGHYLSLGGMRPGTHVIVEFDPKTFAITKYIESFVVLDRQVRDMEVVEEIVELAPGVSQEFKKKRKIDRELFIGARGRVELDMEATYLRSIAAEAKTQFETALGAKLAPSEEIEKALSLNGDKVSKIKVISCEQYRTGNLIVRENGKESKILIQFREGFALKARPAE